MTLSDEALLFRFVVIPLPLCPSSLIASSSFSQQQSFHMKPVPGDFCLPCDRETNSTAFSSSMYRLKQLDYFTLAKSRTSLLAVAQTCRVKQPFFAVVRRQPFLDNLATSASAMTSMPRDGDAEGLDALLLLVYALFSRCNTLATETFHAFNSTQSGPRNLCTGVIFTPRHMDSPLTTR